MSSARLRTFLAVARHASFSAGARAIGLSQPTATNQVQALEREFNVELFHRRGRRIELTTVGRALLPIAGQLALLEAEAANLLRDAGKLNRGQLRIGAVGPFHVIEMVDRYQAQYPQIDVSIRVGNSASVLADLENYVSDIGVLAGLQDDPAFVAQRYARHPVILFAHVDHPFARHDEVPLQALQGQPLLRREQGSTTRLALEQALAEADVSPRIAMEIGSREALREAVIRKLGIGAVSEAEYIADPSLKVIRIAGDAVFTETYLYYLAERRSSRVIDSFLSIALQ
ncbi:MULTISPECIES: LysR substrate-binding domain-containing protein [Pseudomonas]|uniref:LysR substrate-binding domain-containing protein n=1 Tax=Pseudomonas TaxID=286 RepID=UPI000FC2CB4A|nr:MULTISPECIES: LysR substrate-binding domain-containing protein [Pseudomonas]MBG6127908.1 aminoethylphosphonate catabolism LysR family transcriptional regulator [Pseudomonas sp. M2]NSX18971.1 LysR family transcriptional regulator [Pseudomonas putida]GLH32255.1 transcriptional regulator [Pseudomonas sp. BR1R-5]HDS1743793.1 LysR family transcriptional regulator [Pseudomonas putida]